MEKRLLEKPISADQLVEKLLALSETEEVCFLDSCGVSHLGSHFLLAGINPLETYEISDQNPDKILRLLDEKLFTGKTFGIFTISYEFGLKLEKIKPRQKDFPGFGEPDVFLALFDCLLIHDYNLQETYLTGNEKHFGKIEKLLLNPVNPFNPVKSANSRISSNFKKAEYLEQIEKIKEFIRRGDTYQTNLTQQIRAVLPENLTPQQIFYQLRKAHPAPFASFIKRRDSIVVSASPERFFKVENGKWKMENESLPDSALNTQHSALISTSPIKGTRPRGKNASEDAELRKELLNSEKDRAENVMIVDLLRNDLGRICEFGSVRVEKLCDLEAHPTLFHLVSTISGKLSPEIKFSDIIRAVFPCGSITGAPKIRTMQIIDEIETAPRGLSMGAIGYSISSEKLKAKSSENPRFSLFTNHCSLDLSVAIRTMVIKNGEAIFNVGGGIVIDSDPEKEYEESLLKAQALLSSINGALNC